MAGVTGVSVDRRRVECLLEESPVTRHSTLTLYTRPGHLQNISNKTKMSIVNCKSLVLYHLVIVDI